MRVCEMMGFPTSGKVPVFPWRNPHHRRSVEYLFERYDQAGVVPAEQGCVVIDLDCKNGVDGVENFFLKFPETRTLKTLNYQTQSGGWHLWYQVPASAQIPQANGKLPGVDVRHADGYVCIGRDYRIGENGTIAECPTSVLEWLEQPLRTNVGRAVDSGKHWRERECSGSEGGPHDRYRYNLSPFPKGQRNDGMFRWGYGLMKGVKKGELTQDRFEELMNMRGANSQLTRNEIEKIINSLLT